MATRHKSAARRQYARWEKQLRRLHEQLRQRLARRESEARPERGPEDEVGLASLAQAEQIALAEIERDQRLLAEIERALERLARGSFGRCERCQRPIAVPRLRALPWARLCVRCAAGA